MRCWECVVVQVAVRNRRVQQLRKRDGFLHALRENDTPAREDHWKLGFAQNSRRFIERAFVTSATANANRLWNLDLDVAIEIVTRNVQLRWAHLEHCTIEAARRDF